MAIKNLQLGVFSFGQYQSDNLFEAEQPGEENGSAVDDEGDEESNQPVDVHLFDQHGGCDDADEEKHHV
jgi:hypothetical protein